MSQEVTCNSETVLNTANPGCHRAQRKDTWPTLWEGGGESVKTSRSDAAEMDLKTKQK